MMKYFLILTLLLSSCYSDDPAVLDERACAKYMQNAAQRAEARVPSTSVARQACREFIEENPFTKPWKDSGD